MSKVNIEDVIIYNKGKISDLYLKLNNLEKQEKAQKEKQAFTNALKIVNRFKADGIEITDDTLQEISETFATTSKKNTCNADSGNISPIARNIHETKVKIGLLNVKVKRLKKQAVGEAADRGAAWLKKMLDDANIAYTEKSITEFRYRLQKLYIDSEKPEKTEYESLAANSNNSQTA